MTEVKRVGTACRWCRDPIWWAVTEGGKRMPIDLAPDPKGNVVVRAGQAHVLTADEATTDEERWMPHWASCPAVGTRGRP